MNTAVILAGGIGSRMKHHVPKQFIKVHDKPLLMYSLKTFEMNELIDNIIIITLKPMIEEVESWVKEENISKVIKVLPPLKTSIGSAIEVADYIKKNVEGNELIVYHVANRPLVSDNLINSIIKTAKKTGEPVAAAVQCSDALSYHEGDHLVNLIPKEDIYRIQAPYAFTTEQVKWCEEQMELQGIKSSQTLFTLYLELGGKLRMVKGEEQNLRITDKKDLDYYNEIADFFHKKQIYTKRQGSIMIYLIKKVLAFIYFFMKLLPTRNKIVFISRQGNDVPIDFQLLDKEIKSRDKTIKTVFLCKKMKKSILGYISYSFTILRQMYHLATSKVCVLDTYCIPVSLLKHKESLFILQIWHSIGKMKKSGHQTIHERKPKNWLDFENKPGIVNKMNMHKNYDKIIAGAKVFDQYYLDCFNTTEDKLLNYGLPRIDYILNNQEAIRNKIYEKYPEFKNKKVVLYSPTFRNYENKGPEKFIEKFQGEDIALIVTTHPKQKVDLDGYEGVYTCKEFIIEDLLTVCDYFVIDYGSLCLEAAVLDKKTLFYLYDYDMYIENTGLNTDPKKVMKKCAFENIDDIYDIIMKDKYDIKSLEKFKENYLPKDLGQSTKKIVDYIMKEM